MMEYEVFKGIVAAKFKDYLPKEFAEGKVQITPAYKTNVVKDGLTVLMEDQKVTPTVYVDDMYKAFRETHDLEAVLRKIADTYAKAARDVVIDAERYFDFENVKDDIVLKVINTERNKGMLEKMPHREFMDLSVIYVVDVNVKGEKGSIRITNDLMEKYGVTEEELYKTALRNTKKKAPFTIIDMKDIMEEMMGGMEVDNGLKRGDMLVLTNLERSYGANIMLYDDMMQKVAERMGGDFYFLPSSVHELIAVRDDAAPAEELSDMVMAVNADCVDEQECLSDHAYHYDAKLHKLEPAKADPEKELDVSIPSGAAGYTAGKEILSVEVRR